MPWTKNNFPDAMKILEDPIREKVVEIANALLEEGYDDSRAIPIAISQAKAWSENRGGDVSSEITHHHNGGSREISSTFKSSTIKCVLFSFSVLCQFCGQKVLFWS